MKPRLLLVDNDKDYADTARDVLVNAGWKTEVAYSPEKALEKVKYQRFHLCILDKRLRDNYDENDRSGIELIPDLWRLDGLLKFTLLTAFEEISEVKELYSGSFFPSLPVNCEEYIPKGKGFGYLIDQLHKVEKESLKLNWDRNFREDIRFDDILAAFLRDTPQAEEPSRRAQLEEDLELILKWAFYSDSQFPSLKFHPVEAGNRSGAQILVAQAAGRQPWIVKLATRLAVQEEWECYERYEDGLARRPGRVDDMCHQGKYLGTITYRLLNNVLPEKELFNLHQYISNAPDSNTAEAAMEKTVYNAKSWFERERSVGLRDLTTFYTSHFATSQIRQRFERKELKTKDSITLDTLPAEKFGGDVLNPLPFLERSRFLIESSWSICHGDLNSSNILVPSDEPWFIDFASTGPGPTALDWVTLEASLKFDERWPATAEQWFDFESALANPEALDDPLPVPEDLSPELTRLYGAISKMRRTVSEEAGLVSPHGGLLEYFVGLLYATLHQVQFYWRGSKSKKTFEKAHRILASAGLISERLLGEMNRHDDVGVLFRWQGSPPVQMASRLPTAPDVLRAVLRPEDGNNSDSGHASESISSTELIEALRIAHGQFLQSLFADIIDHQSKGTAVERPPVQVELEELLTEGHPHPGDHSGIEYRLKLLQKFKKSIREVEEQLRAKQGN